MLVYAFRVCSTSFISGGVVFSSAGISATGFFVSLWQYAGLFPLFCFSSKNAIEINGKNGKKLQ